MIRIIDNLTGEEIAKREAGLLDQLPEDVKEMVEELLRDMEAVENSEILNQKEL